MSTPPRQPSEEEMRAAYEAEIKRLRVEDVLIQTVVSLVNLAGRKAGLAPGTEDERDPEQLRQAIEASRALLPMVEQQLGQDAAQVKNALSQLQMAYAQMASGQGGQEGEQPAPEQPAPASEQPPQGPGTGPAQSSGRLWVPGQ
jgi:hypothetical protein